MSLTQGGSGSIAFVRRQLTYTTHARSRCTWVNWSSSLSFLENAWPRIEVQFNSLPMVAFWFLAIKNAVPWRQASCNWWCQCVRQVLSGSRWGTTQSIKDDRIKIALPFGSDYYLYCIPLPLLYSVIRSVSHMQLWCVTTDVLKPPAQLLLGPSGTPVELALQVAIRTIVCIAKTMNNWSSSSPPQPLIPSESDDCDL